MRKAIVIAALAMVAAACGGSGSADNDPYGTTAPNNNPAPSTANTVNANPGLAFNPTSVTIAAGSTLTVNFGSVAHTFTFTTAGSPASVPATSNASVGIVFPTAGVYHYMCTIHPTMTGTVTVQ